MHEVVMAHPGHDGRRPRRSRTRSLSQAGKILNFLGTGGAKKIEFELVYLQSGAAGCVQFLLATAGLHLAIFLVLICQSSNPEFL